MIVTLSKMSSALVYLYAFPCLDSFPELLTVKINGVTIQRSCQHALKNYFGKEVY
jgi:hypothetical protein